MIDGGERGDGETGMVEVCGKAKALLVKSGDLWLLQRQCLELQ
jgi:hypothetical protein